MALGTPSGERRTSVEEIFDFLQNEILSLNMRPGDKISEAEIATKFNVSRQPVRDAFSRLANLDLLLIRPQRATEVKRFSMREIEKSRFVRTSVEKEVLRRAAKNCDAKGSAELDAAMLIQNAVIDAGDFEQFGALDYAFHETLCKIAKVEFAYDVILAEKSKVDRLCMLGLSKEARMPELVADHQAITNAIKNHDADAAVSAGMVHFARLDETIKSISETKANYFVEQELRHV